MKLLLLILVVTPVGYLLKDMPTEYEIAVETAEMQLTRPESTTSTSTTTTSTAAVQVLEVRPTTSGPTETSVADGARCPEWWDTARSMGWSEDHLETLDRVIWNESRCQPDATNGADHGLVQVNWSTWKPLVASLGYTKADLYTPAVNLLVGRLIYQTAVNMDYKCPWSPWYMSGSYCD